MVGPASLALAPGASATHTHTTMHFSGAEADLDALARAAAIARAARESRLPVRAYVSVAFGCPYEGAVPVSTVASLATQLLDCGADEIALSDTVGIAHPGQIETLIDSIGSSIPIDRLALHPKAAAMFGDGGGCPDDNDSFGVIHVVTIPAAAATSPNCAT